MKKACIFMISGPSAVGKTSVVNAVLEMDNTLCRIVTCTTRERRDSERDGIDYYFLSKEKFSEEISVGNLIEFSEVYENYYGVMFSTIEEKIKGCQDAILVINWEGFLKIKQAIQGNVFGIFILPPSIRDLEIRIRSRGEDSPEVIAQRIGMAREDMDKAKYYDFCFENIDIATTAREIMKKINEIRFK
ncbi:MAG: guanylate kinase [Holosporaceae bacterium]|jgi:guanylate kinase|nr:guanylate kinase [Holosporaceae bacterium]